MPENTLVLNTEGPETRVAVLEDGKLAEYFMERKRDRGIVGNIYQGKITRVLPGLQAAFVDLGPAVEKAAFLYVGEILGADGHGGFADDEDGKPRRRKRPPSQKIEDLVKPNQKQLVQIVKDPIGMKGARVTGYISLPGRYGVLMPAVDHVGVSRRIGDDKERKRLRDIINDVRPKGMGFIARTAAEGAEDQEVRDDVSFLSRLWTEISARKAKQKKPGLVYADLDPVLRSIRDLLRPDTKEVVIDSEEQYERTRKFVGAFLPRYVERIKHYQGRRPIFDHYGVEPALRTALGRKVPLESGGHLVIDQGEALTAVDVNTGSFVGRDDLEKTVTANNLEACTEIASQLRLRNIGGIIVLDFVDMEKSENRKQVWEAFNKALEADRSRCNVTRLSELGLIEMTRKRTRESLNQLLNEQCPTCHGRGSIRSTTTIANEVLREIRRLGAAVDATTITVECSPAVAGLIQTYEREYIDALEKKFHKMVEIKSTTELRPQEYKVGGVSNIVEEPKKYGKRGKRGSSGKGGKNGKSSRGGRGRGSSRRSGKKSADSSSEKRADASGSTAADAGDGQSVKAAEPAAAASSSGTEKPAAKKPAAKKPAAKKPAAKKAAAKKPAAKKPAAKKAAPKKAAAKKPAAKKAAAKKPAAKKPAAKKPAAKKSAAKKPAAKKAAPKKAAAKTR